MASTLECVGLGVTDQQQFERIVHQVLPSAIRLGERLGVEVVRWQDPSGARLVLGLEHGKVVDLLPSFGGEPGASLSNLTLVSDEVATAAVVDGEGVQVTALALEPEQRRLLDLDSPISGRAAVVSLGVQVEVFVDADAYASSDASLLSTEDDPDSEPPEDCIENGWSWPPRMAAESFFSYGVFGPEQDATAHARIAGTVLSASRREVHLTGQTFFVARVRTVGFETDLCLSSAEHLEAPQPGQVIAGTVFLVGDLQGNPRVEAPRPHRRSFAGQGRRSPGIARVRQGDRMTGGTTSSCAESPTPR